MAGLTCRDHYLLSPLSVTTRRVIQPKVYYIPYYKYLFTGVKVSTTSFALMHKKRSVRTSYPIIQHYDWTILEYKYKTCSTSQFDDYKAWCSHPFFLN